MQQQRTIADSFDQDVTDTSLIKMMDLDILIASGGVLSHAPRAEQTAMMLIDAFLPEGITQLAKDSIFMMPHLGVLAQVHSQAATEVFEKDCLIHLGTCIAPHGTTRKGRLALSYALTLPGGDKKEGTLKAGEMKRFPLEAGNEAQLYLNPPRGLDVGLGKGVPLKSTVKGGIVGLIFDCRGRPIAFDSEVSEKRSQLKTWISELAVYPKEALER